MLLTRTLAAKVSDVGIAKAMSSGQGIELTQARKHSASGIAVKKPGTRSTLHSLDDVQSSTSLKAEFGPK